jgi:long-chain fatty acid transport protein
MGRIARWLVWLAAGLVASGAFAGGAMLYEVGTPDVGLAAAGYAARAQDASTVLTNPAGMSQLKEGDLMLGVQALYGTVEFTPNDQTTVPGSDGGNAIGWFPGMSLFYVHKGSGKLRWGIGTFSNFGAALRYDDDWVGRYYAQEATVIGLSVMPAVSYQLCDHFSIGLAANVMYGYSKNTVAINNIDPRLGDGQLELTDRTWGLGGNIGFLWTPRDDTRLGLTYSSKVSLDFQNTPEWSDLGPGIERVLAARDLLDSRIDLGMSVPQMVMFSFYKKTTDRWAVLGNVGWQDWSQFGRLAIGVNSPNPRSVTVDLDYQDTWHGAVGAQYQTGSPWLLSFGVAYDTSAVDAEKRSPQFPVGAQWRFGGGAEVPLKPTLKLGFAYELQWTGTMSMELDRSPLAGRVAGNFYNTSVQFLTANLNWKF